MNRVLVPLPLVAFILGFCLMVFELAAARILAPTIGSSTYVWTSVIGVIIAALSLGYWLGGRLADRRHQLHDIAWLCLLAGFGVVLALVFSPLILSSLNDIFSDRRAQGVVASLLLFAPTSFVLGMISPYLVKLNITSLASSGKSVANINAFDSIGGIVGTFVAGFILFGLIGSLETFGLVVITLVAISWVLQPQYQTKWRVVASIVIISLCLISLLGRADKIIDTPTSSYVVSTETAQDGGRQVRTIASGPGGVQSAMYVDQPDELVFWYNQQIAAVISQLPEPRRILVLGGGTFTLPRYLASTYSDTQIDVVEIDPGLADIARQYFNYNDPDNVQLIFDDGRAYLNKLSHRYDVVVVDVYGDASVPFSLMTAEFGAQLRRATQPDGAVVANLFAGTSPQCQPLLSALDAPYSSEFRSAQYLNGPQIKGRGNTVAIYSQSPVIYSSYSHDLIRKVSPFSDNFAPVEPLQQTCHS